MSNISDDHEIIDEEELEITLTRNEVLYLDDSLTLMIEREMASASEGMQLSTMRQVIPSAQLPVPIEIIDKIALGVLYTTDPDNVGKDVDLIFVASELYLLRELCQSYVKIGNEPVGYNLKKKIYSVLYENEYKTNKLIDNITSDILTNKTEAPIVHTPNQGYNGWTTEKEGGANDN